MRTGRPKADLVLSEEERSILVPWARRRKTGAGLARRSSIVLECAKGKDNKTVAAALRLSSGTVGKWRSRFASERVDGLLDEGRPGAPRKVDDARVEEIVRQTLETTPKGATHWSTRELSKRTGLSHMTVSRIWRAFGLKPHRAQTFKLSPDPLLVDKLRDIVGLYMSSSDNAVVRCVDEKSQIQALDRTQPMLPMRPEQMERRTHDYRRHGTTPLFAALNVATGNVLGQTHRRHRSVEFRKFLDLIDVSAAQDLAVHLVIDNYATPKSPLIQNWLVKRPRFHVHFTPTYGSWINMVERWFGLLTQRQIKRGSHRSVGELERSIREFLQAHNEDSEPFVWTKSADEILASIARFSQGTTDDQGQRLISRISVTGC